MFKYAFIMNSEKQTPGTYSAIYENPEFYCKVAAVNSMEGCVELAKELAADGIELIDLCGDFDEEKAAQVKKAAGDKTEVCFAKYSREDGAKMEMLASLSEYGIIIYADGMGAKPERRSLECSEFNTRVVFVADDNMAAEAAKTLVDEGICFIELCSYFDAEKAAQISRAIDGKVPVGYCG